MEAEQEAANFKNLYAEAANFKKLYAKAEAEVLHVEAEVVIKLTASTSPGCGWGICIGRLSLAGFGWSRGRKGNDGEKKICTSHICMYKTSFHHNHKRF